jgi:hypothetical protein
MVAQILTRTQNTNPWSLKQVTDEDQFLKNG